MNIQAHDRSIETKKERRRMRKRRNDKKCINRPQVTYVQGICVDITKFANKKHGPCKCWPYKLYRTSIKLSEMGPEHQQHQATQTTSNTRTLAIKHCLSLASSNLLSQSCMANLTIPAFLCFSKLVSTFQHMYYILHVKFYN